MWVDGVDNSGVSKEKLRGCVQLFQELSSISEKFTIAAAVNNVHRSWRPKRWVTDRIPRSIALRLLSAMASVKMNVDTGVQGRLFSGIENPEGADMPDKEDTW